MPLSRHSVGTYPETSLHAVCRETLDHSRLSSLSYYGLVLAQKSKIIVRKLIFTYKNNNNNNKTCGQGMNGRTFSQSPRKRGKSHHNRFTATLLQ